jgi:hypothetical protein
MFHVRRRPSDFHPRKRKKKPGRRSDDEKGSGYRGSYDGQLEPLMIELLPGTVPRNSFQLYIHIIENYVHTLETSRLILYKNQEPLLHF